MPVTLTRDPANRHDPNAVAVRLRGAIAGYLPREIAATWSRRLAEADARGLVATAMAHVWYRWTRPNEEPQLYVHLYIDDEPPDLPPGP